VGFLGQSTEVPVFDRTTRLKKWGLGKGLKEKSMREEEVKRDGGEGQGEAEEDNGTHSLSNESGLSKASPSLHKMNAFGSFHLLDDVDTTHVEEEGDDFFGKNITSKRLAKLYDDALFNYPVFAAGRVYADSLMELLMAQAYFNPNEIAFWEAMLGVGEIDREQRFGEEQQYTFDHSMAQLVSFSTKPSQVHEHMYLELLLLLLLLLLLCVCA
jgi:hypothetical protein